MSCSSRSSLTALTAVVAWTLACGGGTAAQDVRGLTCAPDGETLISWGQDAGYVAVHEAGGDRFLAGGAGWVLGAAFDPSGTKLAVFSGDTRVYDFAGGERLLTVAGHGSGAWYGDRLVLHDDDDRIFRTYDAASGAEGGHLQIRAGSIQESWLVHDGALYTGSGQGVLMRWDGSDDVPPWTAAPGAVEGLAAAGDRILVAGGDGAVHAYTAELERVASWEGPGSWVEAVAVHPSGAAFAAVSRDGVLVRSLPEGDEIASFAPGFEAAAVAWCGGQLHVGGRGGIEAHPDPVAPR